LQNLTTAVAAIASAFPASMDEERTQRFAEQVSEDSHVVPETQAHPSLPALQSEPDPLHAPRPATRQAIHSVSQSRMVFQSYP
jgi:hypothetical protein